MDYGYRAWLIRRALEGRGCSGDRIYYHSSASHTSSWRPTKRVTPDHPRGIPAKGVPAKNNAFWAPTYGKSRFESNVTKADKACLRDSGTPIKITSPYTQRMRPVLDFDRNPPSVHRTPYNPNTDYGAGLRNFLQESAISTSRYDPNRHMIVDIRGRLKLHGKKPAEARPHTSPHSIQGVNVPPPLEEM
jgi:hypothetical protein